MCSTADAQLLRLCLAIDELASRSASTNDSRAGRPDEPADDEIAVRVAAVWAMISEADPELARRLRGYLSPGE